MILVDIVEKRKEQLQREKDNQSLSFLPDHKIPLSFLQKELLR